MVPPPPPPTAAMAAGCTIATSFLLISAVLYGQSQQHSHNIDAPTLVEVRRQLRNKRGAGADKKKKIFDPKSVQVKPILLQQPQQEGPAIATDSLELVDNIDQQQQVTNAEQQVMPSPSPFCFASINDGQIQSTSVIDYEGNFHLALPPNYPASSYNIECIHHKPNGEEEPVDEIQTIDNAPIPQYTPENFQCNPKSFQPGYYNQQTNSWYDICSGYEYDANPDNSLGEAALLQPNCPLLNNIPTDRDIWVSFIGDSVTRQLLEKGFKKIGLPQYGYKCIDLSWNTGRTTKGQGWTRRYADMGLCNYGIDENTGEKHRIWISYTIDYIDHTSMSTLEGSKLPYTWGDFLSERKEGPRSDDPQWAPERTPDIVFFSPGYHASKLDASTYGQVFENILSSWHNAMIQLYNTNQHVTVMPRFHIPLNMSPASWLIPDHYSEDRKDRTRQNEYHKNLAIINTIQKFEFVDSIVDFYSMELPLNGHPGDTYKDGKTVHGDAVHVGDLMNVLFAKRIVDVICHTELLVR